MAGTREKSELKHEFVALMFALAVGQVGIQAGLFVQMPNSYGYQFWPAYSHLLLCLVMIAASWVGWSRSVAPGAVTDATHIFSRSFIILLIDVIIVVEYFIVVTAANFDAKVKNCSAYPECLGITVVFLTYFIWDIVTECGWDRESKLETEIWTGKWRWFIRVGVSFSCFVVATLPTFFLPEVKEPLHVIVCDGAMICLLLIFRALKGNELEGNKLRGNDFYEAKAKAQKNYVIRAVVLMLLMLLCGVYTFSCMPPNLVIQQPH